MTSLIVINKDNCDQVINLSMTEEQAKHAPSVERSIAYACFNPESVMRAIYSEVENDIVGFIMFQKISMMSGNKIQLEEFVIDKKYQRKGYGNSALAQFIAFVRENYPTFKNIRALIDAEDTVSIKLLKKNGFTMDENYILSKIKQKYNDTMVLFVLNL